MALVAQHRRIDGDVLLHARERLRERDRGAQERVVARLHARARLASTTATAEECLEDVAEATSAKTGAAHAAAGLHRVAAAVHDGTLLRIQQHLLRCRDLRELLGSFLGRVHVRVVFACELAVRPFNFLLGGVLVHAEDAVVIASHIFPSIHPAVCG